jgi:hypothetical protein
MTTSSDNSSGATYVSDNTWKTPGGQHFTTPSNDAPTYGAAITIYDRNGGKTAGTWINNEAVKDNTGS